MQKQQHWRTLLALISLTYILVGCSGHTSTSVTNTPSLETTPTPATIALPPPNLTNTISFTTTGQVNGVHTITSLLHTSKLRHGHKEFTIEVASAGQSVIMAFY